MRFQKPAFFILLVLLISSHGLAQVLSGEASTDQAEKKKLLDEFIVETLDRLLVEANGLRLPENRAIVLAITGDLYWKYDNKRAREMFRTSAAELLAYNFEIEKEAQTNPKVNGNELTDAGSVRAQILPMIAKRDADLAMEMLLQTRPAKLAEAMIRIGPTVTKAPGDAASYDPAAQRVSQEVTLEQQIAMLAADSDPDRAIQMIKDSLAKGVSYNVIPLLQKLFKKDEKKAADLAGDVIRKLLDLDLAKNQQDMRLAFSFLQFNSKASAAAASASKEKQFSFTEPQMKDVANKMLTTLLQMPNSAQTTSLIGQAIPLIEKLLPERIVLLKQRHADNQKNLSADAKRQQQRQKLWDQNSTPEDILAQIPKMQNENDRSNSYDVLVYKISEITDEVRAKRLIDQISDDKTRSRALERFETARMNRMVSAGRLDDARRQIGSLTNRRTQITSLVGLATQFYKKGAEKDIESARSIMKEARGLANEFPEDGDDFADLMEIIKGYAVVEPDAGFRLFETLIEPMNEFVQATATLSKFDQRYREFRKGELVMKHTSYTGFSQLVFRYIPQMQLLAKADLERMNSLADRFSRSDSRMIVKLYVLQGFMREDRPPVGTSGGMGVGPR